MSEPTLGVKLVADTASAVQDVKKFTGALDESTTAADAAAGKIQTLGKETAAAKREQIEATNANRKAADQQKILSDTIDKHGAKSKQAAAETKKATAAQEEASRANVKAAASFAKLTDRVLETAKAEGDKLKPATTRALNELEKMGVTAERTARDLQKIELSAKSAATGADKLSKGLSVMTVAGGALIAGGVSRAVTGIGDALAGSVKASIDFESSFAAVTKVLDDKSAGNIANVDAGIKELAADLGVVPTEVAKMSAALAASGLQSDLLGYTEDAAKLGVAFDLTGQEAGHALASLTASLGLSRKEMTALMGTINEMDDGMNSSSKQLVTYLEGVAGIGRAASISGETMLALGSAIISTGTNEDVAATGVKNFIATMESGAAATDAQKEAFEKLGFSAVEVAKQMATGNAEGQIKKMVAAIGALPKEDRFATLIQLFGKESIGSVGGLATNVDLLGQSFKIAGDKAAAAGSVQEEFERVSNSTAHKIEKLKANVEVLAISFGDALIPHITKVVDFLNSDEGKDWGREAVAKAVEVVETLADVVGTVVEGFTWVTDKIGGTGLAVGGLGIAIAGLAGPWGLAAAAGVTAIGYLYDEMGTFLRRLEVVDSAVKSIMQFSGQEGRWEKSRDDDIDKSLMGGGTGGPSYGYGPAPAAALPPGIGPDGEPLDGGGSTSSGKKGKGKGKAKGADKDASKFAMDIMDFDSEVATFAANQAKQIRKDDVASQQEAFDAQSGLFEASNLQFDRELEIIDARGMAEADAQSAREELQDRRLEADQRLADEQMRLAQTDAQREKAQTKLEDIEHKKRIVQLKRVSAEEQKIAEKKAAVQEKIAGLVQDLGGAMVDAAWAAAEGEKGAGLQALSDFAKTVSKKYTLIGLSESAAAIVAAAGVVTAPLAAGHVAAAAAAFGVAAAAGGAAVGLGMAAKSVANSGKVEEDKGGSGLGEAVPGGSMGGGSSSGGSGGGGKQVEAQDVPVSFYDGSKANHAGNNGGGMHYNIMIQGGTWIGKGSAEETAQDIRKLLDQGKGSGKR